MEFHQIYFLVMTSGFIIYMSFWMGIRKWMGRAHQAGWEVLLQLVFFTVGAVFLGPLIFSKAHAQSINVDNSRSVTVIPPSSYLCTASSFQGPGYGFTTYDENCIVRVNSALLNPDDPIGELIRQIETEARVCFTLGIHGTALTSCRKYQSYPEWGAKDETFPDHCEGSYRTRLNCARIEWDRVRGIDRSFKD